LILSGRDGATPAVARRTALTKFALVFVGWTYLLLRVHGRTQTAGRSASGVINLEAGGLVLAPITTLAPQSG